MPRAMTLKRSMVFPLDASSVFPAETAMRRPATAMSSAASVAMPMRSRFETCSNSIWRLPLDPLLYGKLEGLMELAAKQKEVDERLSPGEHHAREGCEAPPDGAAPFAVSPAAARSPLLHAATSTRSARSAAAGRLGRYPPSSSAKAEGAEANETASARPNAASVFFRSIVRYFGNLLPAV